MGSIACTLDIATLRICLAVTLVGMLQ